MDSKRRCLCSGDVWSVFCSHDPPVHRGLLQAWTLVLVSALLDLAKMLVVIVIVPYAVLGFL